MITREHAEISVQKRRAWQTLIDMEVRCFSCERLIHFDLTPEEAEQLANELLSLAQDIRENK